MRPIRGLSQYLVKQKDGDELVGAEKGIIGCSFIFESQQTGLGLNIKGERESFQGCLQEKHLSLQTGQLTAFIQSQGFIRCAHWKEGWVSQGNNESARLQAGLERKTDGADGEKEVGAVNG